MWQKIIENASLVLYDFSRALKAVIRQSVPEQKEDSSHGRNKQYKGLTAVWDCGCRMYG